MKLIPVASLSTRTLRLSTRAVAIAALACSGLMGAFGSQADQMPPSYTWVHPADGGHTVSCDNADNQQVPYRGTKDPFLLGHICSAALEDAALCTYQDCKQNEEITKLQKALLPKPIIHSIKVQMVGGYFEAFVSFGEVEGTGLTYYTTWRDEHRTSTKWYALPR